MVIIRRKFITATAVITLLAGSKSPAVHAVASSIKMNGRPLQSNHGVPLRLNTDRAWL